MSLVCDVIVHIYITKFLLRHDTLLKVKSCGTF